MAEKYVKLTCSNCKEKLDILEGVEELICPFCGTHLGIERQSEVDQKKKKKAKRTRNRPCICCGDPGQWESGKIHYGYKKSDETQYSIEKGREVERRTKTYKILGSFSAPVCERCATKKRNSSCMGYIAWLGFILLSTVFVFNNLGNGKELFIKIFFYVWIFLGINTGYMVFTILRRIYRQQLDFIQEARDNLVKRCKAEEIKDIETKWEKKNKIIETFTQSQMKVTEETYMNLLS